MEVVDQACGRGWTLFHGDSAEVLKGLPDASVDLSLFSPPFRSLFTYSPSERDLGNCKSQEEFEEQFAFIIDELMRIMKPGRNIILHCADLPTTKAHDGVIGLADFPGDLIRQFQRHGFIYHSRATVDKNPQVQAVRLKPKGLLFVQMKKDSAALRQAQADYLIVMQKPGENVVPIKPDISEQDWIVWAHACWYDIRETDTLNTVEAKEKRDERHICPLQLSLVERCVRLWSNRGEVVLDPFAGIGSVGYEAVKIGRRFVGVELKESYYTTAVKNLKRAEQMSGEKSLFDGMGETEEEAAAAVA